MSFLLEAIESRQLLGINSEDKNNLSNYLDYALNNNDVGFISVNLSYCGTKRLVVFGHQ